MLILAIALQAAGEGSRLAMPRLTAPDCRVGDAGEEVVVCARQRDRYRLPLPSEPNGGEFDRHADGGTALAALTPSGRCGIFAGERRCGKREARAYGYGAGRNPIAMLTRLGAKLIHPDAELSAPTQP